MQEEVTQEAMQEKMAQEIADVIAQEMLEEIPQEIPQEIQQEKHVVVLVLGDVGRSPRMQYHAISLAEMPNTKVTLVGYTGERCVSQIYEQPNIQLYTFTPFGIAKRLPRSLFPLYAPFKVIFQVH